jgi:hypothetical protein
MDGAWVAKLSGAARLMAGSLAKRFLPAMLAVLAAVGWLTWRVGTSRPPGTYEVGDYFQSPSESPPSAGQYLALFVDSKCPFCAASVPFYQRLFGLQISETQERRILTMAGIEH